ncbi:hypothetical protein LOAG_09665 [Loa loa]|nr:hypothetical protein LOAG_09665 [Loa loa]EFO18831.1 hypothetical protein LOAG_09665 [Loa loa]
MLQNHLNQCIVTVRTNCPNGYLETLTEENDEDAEMTCHQNQLNHSTHHSALMTSNNTLASSNNDETFNCPIESNGQLKMEPQIKKNY